MNKSEFARVFCSVSLRKFELGVTVQCRIKRHIHVYIQLAYRTQFFGFFFEEKYK